MTDDKKNEQVGGTKKDEQMGVFSPEEAERVMVDESLKVSYKGKKDFTFKPLSSGETQKFMPVFQSIFDEWTKNKEGDMEAAFGLLTDKRLLEYIAVSMGKKVVFLEGQTISFQTWCFNQFLQVLDLGFFVAEMGRMMAKMQEAVSGSSVPSEDLPAKKDGQ
jgi:hypothetical protein